MASPEEEHQEQPEITQPEDGAEGEPVEMTPTAWEMELRTTYVRIKAQIEKVKDDQDKLNFVLEDPNLRVYPYEDEHGVHLALQEKGTLSYLTTAAPDPIPEGGVLVSVVYYRSFLDNYYKKYSSQLAGIEGLLKDMQKQRDDLDVRVSYFRDDQGFGLEANEKEPMGFIVNR